ncbi:hypothetical protein PFISCL1PPCAC_22776, partial [Pristionchus fissidentatus]
VVCEPLISRSPTVTADAYDDQKVVPDVIHCSPENTLTVVWPESGATASVGNELTPTRVHTKPNVWWDADDKELYTLMMTGEVIPPEREVELREALHWLVVNIKGSDVATGHNVADYIAVGPPEGTGSHRYVFTVWRQNRALTSEDYGVSGTKTSLEGRLKFKTMVFAAKASGEEAPMAVAANFF